MPRITAFYAALSALLIVFLALRVSMRRRGSRIGLGDSGDAELARRIRAHANAVEYLPLALLLLLLLELLVTPQFWLHLFGATLVLARVLHAWGLSHSGGTSPGRFLGIVFTWLAIIVMAALLLWRSVLWWWT